MTVNISKPSLNLREELAALRNQSGAYEESKFYLDSLVTNGTFDSDVSGWVNLFSARGTPTLVANKLRVTNDGSGGCILYQAVTTVEGRVYSITVDGVSAGTATAKLAVGASAGSASLYYASIGVGHTATFVAGGILTYINLEALGAAGGAGDYADYDNISVYETDGTDAIHSTPHGYSIKDVYIDGELAREGSAYDYTVHDGYIKPTIAPTATTETCLIGVRT